jgi:hypothetical protein
MIEDAITDTLRIACAVLDEVLPYQLPAGRGQNHADRIEMRKAALPLVFGALLA